MELHHLFALTAGFGYALAAVFSKRALQLGCGILRLSFVINLAFVAVFALLFLGGMEPVRWDRLHLPVMAGGLFFLGQIFTFAAIRMGDVSLQTPMMGTKAVFVVAIAAFLGTEPVDGGLWAAAFLAATAVGVLGFSGDGAERVALTLGLALASSLFFAGADLMVGTYGLGFGPRNFIFIAIVVNGLLSVGLIPFFREPLASIPQRAMPWVVLAALGMAGQALLLNYTLARYQDVAAINILYSARGLLSVFLAAPLAGILAIPRETAGRRAVVLRLLGALLMSGAITLVLTS